MDSDALVLAVPDSSDPDHEWSKGFFDPSWWSTDGRYRSTGTMC
jgi:hypothetical protein